MFVLWVADTEALYQAETNFTLLPKSIRVDLADSPKY